MATRPRPHFFIKGERTTATRLNTLRPFRDGVRPQDAQAQPLPEEATVTEDTAGADGLPEGGTAERWELEVRTSEVERLEDADDSETFILADQPLSLTFRRPDGSRVILPLE